jgi:hypothetical protein
MMHQKDERMKDDSSMDNLPAASYDPFLVGITIVLDTARRQAARVVNTILTAAYWETGRRSVEFQQGGMEREDIRDTVSDIGIEGTILSTVVDIRLGRREVAHARPVTTKTLSDGIVI